MADNTTQQKKPNYLMRALCALLAVIICGVLVSGATLDWGKVKYTRITFNFSDYGENGVPSVYEGSAVMYIPKTASIDTPAPGVITTHGVSTNGQSMSNYGIELARRGYVVMMVDLPCSGYTDMVGQETSMQHDMTIFLEEAAKVMDSMNFVQKGNMTALGFSAGCRKSGPQAANNKDLFNCLILGSNLTTNKTYSGPEYEGLNIIGITSDKKLCGTPVAVSGNPAERNYRVDYCFEEYETHIMMTVDSESMYAVCHYLNEVNPAPNYIDGNDQVFIWAHLFSILGYVSVIAFLVTVAQAFVNTSALADIKRAAFPRFDTKDPKWMDIAFIIGTMVLNVAAMLILVVELQIVPKETGLPAIPLWFNIYIPYFLALGVIDLLIFIFRFHLRYGKKQGGNAVKYGILAEGGAKASAAMIGKSLAVGLLTGASLFAVLMCIESYLGVRFNFYDWALNVGPAKLLVHSWFYILMYLFMFVCGNLNNFVAKPDKQNTLLGDVKEIAFKTFCACAPILFLVMLNTARGMGWIPGATNQPLDHLCGYTFTIIVASVVNNVITKKTKNIWVGAATCAVYLGFAVTFAYSYQATLFG